jgi:hypothetical protein
MKETGMMCNQRWGLIGLGKNPNSVASNLISGLDEAGDSDESEG